MRHYVAKALSMRAVFNESIVNVVNVFRSMFIVSLWATSLELFRALYCRDQNHYWTLYSNYSCETPSHGHMINDFLERQREVNYS